MAMSQLFNAVGRRMTVAVGQRGEFSSIVSPSPILCGRGDKKTKKFKGSSRTLTSSSSSCINSCNQILDIINESLPFEPKLNKLTGFLSKDVLLSVLESQAKKDPKICFRFFIWAAAGLPFSQTKLSHNLIVDMLLTGQKAGFFDLYWSVLDELATQNQNLPLPVHAFYVLILAYCRSGNAEKAIETFGKMRDYGCQPNSDLYNLLLNVLVKKNTVLLALAVFKLMSKSNFTINCQSYNIVIYGLCKNKMVQDALMLFDEMLLHCVWPNTLTYNTMISGLCKAKRVDDALRLFNVMKDSGCKPDGVTYNVLLNGFCTSDRIHEAVKLTLSFRKEGYKIGIEGFTCLIDGWVRAKRITQAEEWFQKFLDVGLLPDAALYSVVMRGLIEAGRRNDAVGMLRDMIGRGITPNTRCYNLLIRAFCYAGLLDQAKSLTREIFNHEQFPDTYTCNTLIWGMCRKGLLGEAQDIFNDMEKHGCSPSVVTYNTLIDGLCKAGKLEEAHLMSYQMEIGKNPSVFLRLTQAARILDKGGLQKSLEELVEAGLFLKAYRLLGQISDSGVMPDIWTYNILINGMCKVGMVNGAYKLFEELQLKGHVPNFVTYATLIDGLQRVERGNEAAKVFEKMKQNGCEPSSAVYKSLMTWSCRRGKIDQASGFWLKYLSSLCRREVAQLKLVEECFGKGEFEKGFKRLLEMEIKLTDFDSAPYNILLMGMCQANRVEEALRLFSLLEQFSVAVSAPSCVKLIAALCSKGYLNEANDVLRYTIKKGYRLKYILWRMSSTLRRLVKNIYLNSVVESS